MNEQVQMLLSLRLDGDRPVVTLANTSQNPERFWDLENSWGWDSLWFELRASDSRVARITRRSRDWTKNAPSWFELKPDESRTIEVDFQDGWWEAQDLGAVAGQHCALRAHWDIEPSPESDEYRVFIGSMESNAVRFAVPGDWRPRRES